MRKTHEKPWDIAMKFHSIFIASKLVVDVHWRGEILGCPYLCIMCGRGCTLEGGNPGVSLPLHNVWERMYAGGGKSWGVPTSA